MFLKVITTMFYFCFIFIILLLLFYFYAFLLFYLSFLRLEIQVRISIDTFLPFPLSPVMKSIYYDYIWDCGGRAGVWGRRVGRGSRGKQKRLITSLIHILLTANFEHHNHRICPESRTVRPEQTV